MWFWIVIAVLYLLNWAFLRWIGGVSAAGDALRTWGRASSRVRHAHGASS
jgi:hypothetical protein